MGRGQTTSLNVAICAEDRRVLESWQRSTTIPVGLAKRGRIILVLATGTSVTDTARTVGIARRLVYKWANRFLSEGIPGLHDKPRPGRKPVFSPRCRR